MLTFVDNTSEWGQCPHPGCDRVNSPEARFCGRCGRPLTPAALPSATQRSRIGWPGMLTLLALGLFASLVVHHIAPIGLVFAGLAVIVIRRKL